VSDAPLPVQADSLSWGELDLIDFNTLDIDGARKQSRQQRFIWR
jgi:hypothetical protein